MTTPPKPWESGGISQVQMPGLQQQQQQIFPGGSHARSSTLGNGTAHQGYAYGTPTSAAPRPPPRPASSAVSRFGGTRGYGNTAGYSSYGGGYGSMGSMYSPYGGMRGYGTYGSSYGSPYSSYGMMGGYGSGYGTGYGSYSPYGQQPYGHGLENRFIQLAEENSRPAFESLESLVHAFGSVSMMLESTFFAIHSSFRAVLGVAENFGRMRGLLAQVFSALTIFRAVRWAAHRLLELLRLRKPGAAEQVWAEATSGAGPQLTAGGSSTPDEAQKSSAWPIVMFMSLVVGGPYLIWKLLRSVQSSLSDDSNTSTPGSRQGEEAWMNGCSPCYIAQAAYSFQSRQEDELSFMAGDVLAMAPSEQQPLRSQGWMLATRLQDAAGTQVPRPSQVGLVPANHFRTLYSKTSNSKSTVTPEGQASVPISSTSQSNNIPLAQNIPVAPLSNLETIPEAAIPNPSTNSTSSQNVASTSSISTPIPPDPLGLAVPVESGADSDDNNTTPVPTPQHQNPLPK